MTDLLISNARLLTLSGEQGPRRGAALGDLSAIDAADVLIRDGVIQTVGNTGQRLSPTDECATIDTQGRCVMPAFVDCHTHACWAGNRLDEWSQKLRGATYLELLAAGGGIMSTVRAVRAAKQTELAELLLQRLWNMLRQGTTTVEVKSGYGLSTDAELKMLRAIDEASRSWPGRVIATACIGHAIDPDQPADDFVDRTIRETLPAVTAEFPGVAIDAYCEEGAWSLSQTLRLFEAAQSAGHPIRVHADQFNELGIVDFAIAKQFVSVDHLEATCSESLQKLAESDCFGVMLPVSGFHLDGRYADGRSFVDAGGALALATNYNPGSAPCYSMPTMMSLAVRHLGLTPEEAIAASTRNGALLLGQHDMGVIEVGHRADLLILNTSDERQLAFEFGGNPVQMTICHGQPMGMVS